VCVCVLVRRMNSEYEWFCIRTKDFDRYVCAYVKVWRSSPLNHFTTCDWLSNQDRRCQSSPNERRTLYCMQANCKIYEILIGNIERLCFHFWLSFANFAFTNRSSFFKDLDVDYHHLLWGLHYEWVLWCGERNRVEWDGLLYIFPLVV